MGDVATLGSLCTDVVDCPHSTPVWTDAGVLVLRSHNIRRGRLDLSRPSFTSEDAYGERTRRATPSPGDLVITREAPMGEICEIPRGLRCCLGQRLVLLRPNPGRVVGKYLCYAIQAPQVQGQIRAHDGTGSTVSNLRIPALEALTIPIRPLPEQAAISSLLGALDDKIALNRRMAATLEEMARALFKSWFVDFDPVRAKAEGRDTGLPSEIADLFPDRLVDSDLGAIPDGWAVSRLVDRVDTVKGRSYRSTELVTDAPTAMVTLKSFRRGGGYRADGLKPFIGTYRAEQVVLPGELVIANTDVTQLADVVGQPALVRSDSRYSTLVASLDAQIVRGTDDRTSAVFLYGLAGSRAFNSHARAHATGTTVLHLAKGAIESFAFAGPPPGLVRAYDSLALPALQALDRLGEETDALAALRDALLPKLVSGEIRISDPEDFLARMEAVG